MRRLIQICLALATTGVHAQALTLVPPDEASWQEIRPDVYRVLLQGDPAQPGPFVYRIRVPAGFEAPWHVHSQDLNSTILSGAVRFVYDDGAVELPVLGFAAVPANVPHREIALIATEMEVRGIGPVVTTPVSPAPE